MIKTVIASAAAAAFALPFWAQASATSDTIVVAQGGGDTGASARQPGVNPPGAASPGSSSTGVSGTDRDSGAAARTNPSSAGATVSGFDRLDKNGDGFISRDEARDADELNTRFAELDQDNDGRVSRDEYNAGNRGSAGGTK